LGSSLLEGLTPHLIQPVASALAHAGQPFRCASSAIDMWSYGKRQVENCEAILIAWRFRLRSSSGHKLVTHPTAVGTVKEHMTKVGV